MMKIKYTILLLMLIAAVSKAWAEATVSILPSENGTVTYGMSGSTVTLTVTPNENYFLHENDLKVRMSVDGGNADARTRTGVNPGLTDYLAVTNNHNGTFTFILPDKDYEYVAHVTAVFRPVTVELSANSFTYNAAVQKPTLTVTFNGSTLTSTTDFLATYSGNCKDAGDYTVTITGKGEYVGTTSAFPYTIVPKTVGLTWSTPQAFVYDGTAKVLTATATGVESGDECTVTVICNAVPYYGYTATAGDQRPNYNTLIQHLVDNNLNTKWCPEWGTTKSGVLYVEFHTEEPIYPIGYTFYTGDDTSTFPSRNPRSWRLLARKTESDGWTAIATVENNMSIGFVNKTPYDFSLDVVGESYKYYRFEVSEHRDDQYDYFSSQHQLQLQDFHLNVPDDRNAGTHTAYATALSNPNYALPEVKSQSFTITPRPVTLTWDNTGTGETKLIYNGSAYIPTATAGNLVGEDVCTVTVTGEQINVGDYTATASALSNSNYKLPDDPTQSFTISPKAIGDGSATPATDITLTGIDESYVYTGSELQPVVTLTYDQLPGTDKTIAAASNYTVTYTDEDHDNLTVAKGGVVTITAEGNYTGSIVKPFDITPKAFSTDAISIGVIPHQTYNGMELTPVVTLHDVARDVDLDAADFTVTKHKDAGTHTVTITAQGNYQAELTAPFTIDPKTVTLTWSNLVFDYDGTDKLASAEVSNLEGEDECAVTVTGSASAVGVHTATATALDNTNYQLPTDDADKQTTFEILKIFSYGANKTWMTFFDGAEDLEFKDGEEDKIETYVVTEASGSTVTVVNTGGKIYQNVPMLLKRTGEETIIRAHKAESLAALSATPFENFYGGVTDLTNYKNVYVLVGSEFLPTTGTTIDAERCFLALGGMVTAPTRMVIVVDNETTGLTPCPIPMVEGSYWYTLDGRKLSGIPAKKGMYIWNGKKVVIK